MTIEINTLGKYKTAEHMANYGEMSGPLTGGKIYVFPSTVAMPTSPILAPASLPTGFILTYTYSGTSLKAVNGVISFAAATSPTAITTAAGTISWVAIVNTSTLISNSSTAPNLTSNQNSRAILITDSVSTPALGSAVFTFSNLNVTNGETVSVSLSLKLL